jgi:hypothetical protein
MKIGDIVRVSKPNHPLHGHQGRIWANRDWPEKHGDKRRWMIDFTPDLGCRDTFFEGELVMCEHCSDDGYIAIRRSEAEKIERQLRAYEIALENVLYRQNPHTTKDDLEKVREALEILDYAETPREISF